MTMKTAQKKYRLVYASWAILECLGFGGLLYGWGSLVFVLKEEGLYTDLCGYASVNTSISNIATSDVSGNDNVGYTNASDGFEFQDVQITKCDERDAKLNLVFTIAMALFCVGCFIMGQVNFMFGTRITRIAASFIFTVGALGVAFTSNDVPWLIFPGLSLIGMGGITFLVTNFQISLLFSTGGATIVGLLSGAFDSSSGIQLLVKIGYENGISRKTSYIILAVVQFVTLISTFFFLPKDFIKKPEPPKQGNDIADDETAVQLVNSNGKNKDIDSGTADVPKKEVTLKDCLLSPTYLLHLFWLSFLQLRFYFLLGSMNKMFEVELESKDEVSNYTNVLMYMMFCGVFIAPLAGIVCDFNVRLFAKSRTEFRRAVMPKVFPLALTTLLCIIMSGLILVQDPQVYYAVFIFLLFFRAFLYTLAAGYISAIFPNNLFGILYGILIITGGIVSMLQYALFNWAEASGFQEVNIFLFALMFITFLHPAYQWFQCVRVERTGDLQK